MAEAEATRDKAGDGCVRVSNLCLSSSSHSAPCPIRPRMCFCSKHCPAHCLQDKLPYHGRRARSAAASSSANVAAMPHSHPRPRRHPARPCRRRLRSCLCPALRYALGAPQPARPHGCRGAMACRHRPSASSVGLRRPVNNTRGKPLILIVACATWGKPR